MTPQSSWNIVWVGTEKKNRRSRILGDRLRNAIFRTWHARWEHGLIASVVAWAELAQQWMCQQLTRGEEEVLMDSECGKTIISVLDTCEPTRLHGIFPNLWSCWLPWLNSMSHKSTECVRGIVDGRAHDKSVRETRVESENNQNSLNTSMKFQKTNLINHFDQ